MFMRLGCPIIVTLSIKGHQAQKEAPNIQVAQQSTVCESKKPGSMAEEVKLFGVRVRSPYSHRVEIALKLKGVQYEYIEEDLSNKSPLLLKYNPVHKKIPVLVHNGKPIAESVVILEYIEETWKANPILPEDPYERAMARFWAKFLDDKCLPAIRNVFWGPEMEREKAIEEASEQLKILENELKGKRFFGGETIGLADIVANFLGYWVGFLQETRGVELLTREKFPILFKWIDEFLSCSVINENLPPRDKLLAFFKAHFEAIAAAK